ncbi:unnamed protein product [Alternaria alternata]
MDGDVCPLKQMVEVVEEVLGHERGYIVMDEAHSTGVLGPEGRGLSPNDSKRMSKIAHLCSAASKTKSIGKLPAKSQYDGSSCGTTDSASGYW